MAARSPRSAISLRCWREMFMPRSTSSTIRLSTSPQSGRACSRASIGRRSAAALPLTPRPCVSLIDRTSARGPRSPRKTGLFTSLCCSKCSFKATWRSNADGLFALNAECRRRGLWKQLMYWKRAVSAWRRVSRHPRQISSALMVFDEGEEDQKTVQRTVFLT